MERAHHIDAKQKIAKALLSRLRNTRLSNITVTSLTDDAGVNRQAFYYHFRDIFDAVEWVFNEEVVYAAMKQANYSGWSQGFRLLLEFLNENHSEIKMVFNSVKFEKIEQFLFRVLSSMTRAVVVELSQDLNISEKNKDFVIKHYTLSVLGHIFHLIASEKEINTDEFLDNLELILYKQVSLSLERYAR